MIEIRQISLPQGSDLKALQEKTEKMLHLKQGEILELVILRHSVDARKKPVLFDVYTAGAKLKGGLAEEKKKAARLHSGNIVIHTEETYTFPDPDEDAKRLKHRPLVIGFGPAGIFAARELALHGYRPVVLERGGNMAERTASVKRFFKTGELDPESNIQFGEGGAGTFSDGKLTTGVRDKAGRHRHVMDAFVAAGAPGDILYEQLPHIGTDRLRAVIVRMRQEIIRLGGEIRFHCAVRNIHVTNGRVDGVLTDEGFLPAEVVILAPGHSARDLIRKLYAEGVPMTQKNFAVGFRVSHPQQKINEWQYGIRDEESMRKRGLSAVSYKLTATASSGRGVYSFCMCPGGYVVNASSEPGRLAVNGMSDYARDSERANSAVIMTVGEKEFGSGEVLAGIRFQEKLEEKAYSLASGRIPVESYADFREGRQTPHGQVRDLTSEEEEKLCIRGLASFAPLHSLLPEDLTDDFLEGMECFNRKIRGFTDKDTYVIGLESRTSSPVRITRNDNLESSIRGLFPCGEGAGFAGGIMSAAIDGMKAAEAVARKYRISEDEA